MKIIRALLFAQLALACPPLLSQTDGANYSITISTDDPVVKLPNDVVIDITFTNLTGHEVRCKRRQINSYLDPAFQYDVRSLDGTTVPLVLPPHSEYYNNSNGVPCIIPPGQTIRSLADISRTYIRGPGEYLVKISQSDLASGKPVVSNEIRIKVVAKDDAGR